jgi:hypothetical protein
VERGRQLDTQDAQIPYHPSAIRFHFIDRPALGAVRNDGRCRNGETAGKLRLF